MDTSRGTYHSEGRYRALTLLVRKSSQRSIFASQKDPQSGRQFSVGKGRSCNHSMLRVTQKLGALALNVSDGPSGARLLRGTSSHQATRRSRVGIKDIRSTQRSLPHPKGPGAMSPLEPNIRKPVAVKKKTKTNRRAVVAVSPCWKHS